MSGDTAHTSACATQLTQDYSFACIGEARDRDRQFSFDCYFSEQRFDGGDFRWLDGAVGCQVGRDIGKVAELVGIAECDESYGLFCRDQVLHKIREHARQACVTSFRSHRGERGDDVLTCIRATLYQLIEFRSGHGGIGPKDDGLRQALFHLRGELSSLRGNCTFDQHVEDG